MGLREFLQTHHASTPEGGPRSKIATWKAAVSTLDARFKEVLGKFPQIRLTEWSVLREHAGVRYNIEALTISFEDADITLEPLAIEPEAGILGRSSLERGVRQVHLDCGTDGALWRYHWVIPHDPAKSELTDAAIEEIIEQLLK